METDIHNNSMEELAIATEVLELTSPRSEFAAVIFHNIPETYPADADLECMYTLTSDIYPSTRDYIGLYKVGWMSYRHYVYYEWAPWPEQYEAGKDVDNKVIFPSGKLPKDDGDFYQFCYVMSTGQIRGASMPFQFKRLCADDFVEEMDEESDMLVIRSKTVVLEEKVKHAEDERTKLIQTQENLERERESLIAKMTEQNRLLATEKDSTMYLQEQLRLYHDRIVQLNKEAMDSMLNQEQLQQKLEDVTQSKRDVDDKVLALDTEIKDLKQLIKSLESEKDELMGKNLSLEQEKELYKSHVISSESMVSNHQCEVAELKTELDEYREELKIVKVGFLAAKVALETEKSELQKQSSSSSNDKSKIEELVECLRNVEDKLATEENTKRMLTEEILAFQITQQKMSRSLEDSSLESDKLREQLNRYELQTKSLNEVIETLKAERAVREEEMRAAHAELKHLSATEVEISILHNKLLHTSNLEQEISRLKEQEKRATEQQGREQEITEAANAASHFALQKANATLRERLARSTKRCDQLQLHKDELIKKTKQQEERVKDLAREVDDLRERIFMCSSEYKTLFGKNRKLQKKLDRVEKFGIRTKSKSENGEDLAKSSTSTDTDAVAPVEEPGSITVALQQRVELLSSDLEQKRLKKGKYKKLYQEEKERQDMLRKHYYEESRGAEDEIEKLKLKNSNMKEEFDLKCRSMQNLLSKKEKEFEELTRSRLEVLQQLREKDRPPVSPRKEGGAVTSPPQAVLMYPNPYAGVASEWQLRYPPQTMAYPGYPQPLPPTIHYPAQTTRESSASCPEQPCPIVMDRSDSVHVEIDRLSESEASGPLDPPLLHTGPLDPPLQPTIMPIAKVAAVRSAIQPDGHVCMKEDFVLTLESSMEGETIEKVPVTPSAPLVNSDCVDGEEDRYQDAAGEGMKICPSCNETFPHDVNERDFELHIIGHFGKICPLCDAQLDANCSSQDFEAHVNGHFQD